MLFQTGFKRYALLALGTIALILAVVGIFLPILPTTPFLLVTAYCYLRSSPRLYTWLMNHRVLGRYISDYVHHRSVSRKAKILALSTLWPSLFISMLLVPLTWVRVLLTIIGVLVSTHILSLKERKQLD